MDIRTGIIQAAESLGISPVDLATAISYETAGTFDPLKRGPTTQWGQHRGLIQFGEPQAVENGVDWNDPLGSQLGPEGAVVRYLRRAGVKPGMGMMDVYSAINAGAPGRYGASDANNGGAPGTVADKVNGQMSGHRENALRLMGQTVPVSSGGADAGQANNPPPVDMNPARLAWAYRTGRMTPEDKALYERGLAAGKFQAPAQPAAQPDPLAVYAQTAQRPRAPLQAIDIGAGMKQSQWPGLAG